MKREFLLEGLDCANCAAKIQREVGLLPGVSEVSVNLLRQTLTLQAEPEAGAGIKDRVEAIVHSHEPHVEVLEPRASLRGEEKPGAGEEDSRGRLFRLAVGAVLYGIGLLLTKVLGLPLTAELAVLIAAYLILGGDVLLRAGKTICSGHIFDENFLMSLASLCAFAIGEYPEAVAVMLFYQVGEYFQDRAVHRSRRSIAELMDIRPDTAQVRQGGQWVTVHPEEVSAGERILVKPGERIPLDGVVEQGDSMLDTSALTGESVPRRARPGEAVLSGSVNLRGALTIRVTRGYGESTAARILELVEHAADRKAPTEHFITAFARYYTPVVVILAVLLALVPPLFLGGLWAEWLRRGCVFLVISCPCALVISIPLAFFGGIGACSRHGVLVKGSNYLEALNHVDTVVFDKTGTLTEGVFRVTEILPGEGFTREEVLRLAASAEGLSNHPIAQSIREAAGGPGDPEAITDCREIPGQGVLLSMGGRRLLAGNERLMEAEGISCLPPERPGTRVYVAVDGRYAGCILITDVVKEDSREAVRSLKELGIRRTLLLTGDDETIARYTADALGLDGWYGGLLPDQKVEQLEEIMGETGTGGKTVFVGDGINDAPVLARADVGIAMGGLGSDAAIEAADVVLMTDEPSRLAEALIIARETRRIVVQNIVLALGIKGACLALGAVGIAGMWEAVFADVGVALLAVVNSMRMLKK